MDSWIDVKSKPPAYEEEVLVRCKNGARFVATRQYLTYDKSDGWFVKGPLGTGRRIATSRITHWAKLPPDLIGEVLG